MTRLSSTSARARYTAAAGCSLCAVLVRLVFQPWLGGSLPYVVVYPAVMICARFWGVGPATVVLLSSAAVTPVFTGAPDPIRTLLLLSVGSFAIWIIAALRQAQVKAESSAQIAEERLHQLHEEAAHRAREERISNQLRALVESSGDAILSTDLQGVIQSWNQGAEQVFGYTSAETLGHDIALLLPADRAHEETEIIDRIRQGGLVKHFETVRRRKDGKEIPVSLTISPVLEGSQIVGASHIARDISERKELEEHLLQSQKLESLGVLAGGLAHDFNNLLTGIMGNTSLAMQEVSESAPAHDRMSEVLHTSERAALLVRQMLAYAGKGRFVIERLNLSALVADIVPLVRPSFSRMVELDLRLERDLPYLEGDRAQIQQLVMNLVVNAAEAVGERPGQVIVKTYQRESDGEPQVVFEVKDTGCGMDAEVQARIFDPFFTTKFTGRGLGLSAAMGIIRAHRATIAVESVPGKGSTFTVAFPVAIAGPASGAPRVDLPGRGAVLDEKIVH